MTTDQFKPFIKTINTRDGKVKTPIAVGRAPSSKVNELPDRHNVYIDDSQISAKHFTFDDGKLVNHSTSSILYTENMFCDPKIVRQAANVKRKYQLICIGFHLSESDVKSMSPEKVIESSRIVLIFHQISSFKYKIYCSRSEDFVKQFKSFFQQRIEMYDTNYFEYTVFLKYLFHMAKTIKKEEELLQNYVSEDDADYMQSDFSSETEDSEDEEEEEEDDDDDDKFKSTKNFFSSWDIIYDESGDQDLDYEIEYDKTDIEIKEETVDSDSIQIAEHDKIEKYEKNDSNAALEGKAERPEGPDDVDDIIENEGTTDSQSTNRIIQSEQSNERNKKRSFDEMNSCLSNLSEVIVDQQRIIKKHESEIGQLKRSRHIKKLAAGFISGSIATICTFATLGALLEYGKHKNSFE